MTREKGESKNHEKRMTVFMNDPYYNYETNNQNNKIVQKLNKPSKIWINGTWKIKSDGSQIWEKGHWEFKEKTFQKKSEILRRMLKEKNRV